MPLFISSSGFSSKLPIFDLSCFIYDFNGDLFMSMNHEHAYGLYRMPFSLIWYLIFWLLVILPRLFGVYLLLWCSRYLEIRLLLLKSLFTILWKNSSRFGCLVLNNERPESLMLSWLLAISRLIPVFIWDSFGRLLSKLLSCSW